MQKSTPTKFKTFISRNQLKQAPANPKLKQALAAANRRSRSSESPESYWRRADGSYLAAKVIKIIRHGK